MITYEQQKENHSKAKKALEIAKNQNKGKKLVMLNNKTWKLIQNDYKLTKFIKMNIETYCTTQSN